MPSYRHSLLEGDIAPHIRRLSVPMMWGMLSLTLFSVVDTIFISKLGTKYLAALGFTIPMVMFYLGIIFGLSVGTASVISRAYGEGGEEKVRRLATDAVVLGGIISVAASVVGWFLIDPIFRLMGASEELLPVIHRYMTIWYIGLPFFGLMITGNSCVRGTGDTKFPSYLMMFMSALNIIVDPILIFGWGPFPALGLSGAAVTLVVSYYLTCVVCFYFLIFKKRLLVPGLFHAGTIAGWKRILHVAVPSMISNQIGPVSAAIITWMAADIGREAVAALGVATRIEGIVTLVFYAVGAGVSVFTGQNFGAGNYGRIAEAVRTGCFYVLGWGFLVAVITFPFARDIPHFFDSNENVILYTQQYLHWVPISFGGLGVVIICNAALNAMGRPGAATTLIALRAVLLYVPLAWFMKETYGFFGIVIAMAMTNVIVGAISYMLNRKLTP